MMTRELGKTGLMVTPIGLGLAALGRPGYINLGHAQDLSHSYDVAAMEAHAHVVLDAAWEAGIRYFDAARSYGRAEQFISTWLAARHISPGQVTVGSKWGYTYTADWQIEAEKHEVKEHSLPVLQRQTQESLALLGSHLKLYQIHSATLESGVLQNTAVLNELARLKTEAGLKIGLSLSGAAQAKTLRRALDVRLPDGSPLFDAVQATWNLLEPSAGPALAEAKAEGLGVIVKEAVANGRLTPRNTSPDIASLRAAADALGATVDALAIAAVLAQPWVDVALSGAAAVAHLQANVKALQIEWDEEWNGRFQILAEPPAQYWQTRSNLAWN
ncbi:MAG: aldo/keto reductase [Anaerolineales bacterium]|nr:aldo/keto reductase [Anaerolineales bacterium]MCB8991092.1 aldo/keto reductase [Ardenticatenaceae bacterium]MCB9004134.1 aldo/keto reductase [Ardenticatenaceae bacterium]